MNKNENIALVLSGGGAKGAFQVGALQILKENGYDFNVISGVSVGTLNGSMLATKQFETLVQIWENLEPKDVLKEDSLLKIARKFIAYKIRFGKPPVSKFNNSPLQQLLQKHLLGKNVSIPFYFGFVKLDTGEYIQSTIRRHEDHKIDEMDFNRILASTAIPVIFNPVLQNGSTWVDGGLRNISPIKEVIPFNPDKVIIIPTEPLNKTIDSAEVKDIIHIAFQTITIMLDEIFQEDIDRFININTLVQQAESKDVVLKKPNGTPYKYIEPLIIAPETSLGSPINFNNTHLNNLIEIGKNRAKEVLNGLNT